MGIDATELLKDAIDQFAGGREWPPAARAQGSGGNGDQTSSFPSCGSVTECVGREGQNDYTIDGSGVIYAERKIIQKFKEAADEITSGPGERHRSMTSTMLL